MKQGFIQTSNTEKRLKVKVYMDNLVTKQYEDDALKTIKNTLNQLMCYEIGQHDSKRVLIE